MALIVMAVFDTEENKRTDFTQKCIASLLATTNLAKHRLCFVDNASCRETKSFLYGAKIRVNNWNKEERVTIITNEENIGTAKAVNKGIKLRQPGEYVIKMDNDVTFHKRNWVDEMEEVISRMPSIGILGLKRNDLMESPYAINTEQRSRLLEVDHKPGQKWYVVEDCKHVMGTCTMINHLLLDKVGYFYQMNGLYGFDDSLLCVRSNVAGFLNCFLHGVSIDHIDPGGGEYTDWKDKYAGEMLTKYGQEEHDYRNGLKSIYHED